MVTIYELFNAENGMAYVGSTASKLAKRMREHRCLLRAGKHSEQGLQADWIRYGELAFSIRPIMQVAKELRAPSEVAYMEAIGARAYNTKRFAYRPPPGASALAVKARIANGYRHSPESNEKRRLAQLGKPKGHGWKISLTKQRKRDEIVSSARNKELAGAG